MADLFSLAGPLLRRLDAETAHGLTIATLASGFAQFSPPPGSENLRVDLFGLRFPNPLGMAAGFDKNAEVPDAVLKMGFGFCEVGTVTPRPQVGNPKPRLFRLEPDLAVINRMGFNNDGHDAVRARLERGTRAGILGVNIGANKTSDDRVADYVAGLERFHDLASYLTVNVSSPNTPGLRGLQSREELTDLITRLLDARARLASAVPLLLKIAPDLIDDELDDIAAVCLDLEIDGLIVSNTTIARPSLASPHAAEAGGLSGAPLFEPSTVVLAKMYRRTGGRLPIIGVGGISSGETAWQKIRAGASLLQLYSALIYKGPGLVHEICGHLAEQLQKGGYNTLLEATGSGAGEWASKTE